MALLVKVSDKVLLNLSCSYWWAAYQTIMSLLVKKYYRTFRWIGPTVIDGQLLVISYQGNWSFYSGNIQLFQFIFLSLIASTYFSYSCLGRHLLSLFICFLSVFLLSNMSFLSTHPHWVCSSRKLFLIIVYFLYFKLAKPLKVTIALPSFYL